MFLSCLIKAGLPTIKECTERAQELEANGDVDCIKYYLLSSTPERALELGITKITGTSGRCSRNLLRFILCLFGFRAVRLIRFALR